MWLKNMSLLKKYYDIIIMRNLYNIALGKILQKLKKQTEGFNT